MLSVSESLDVCTDNSANKTNIIDMQGSGGF